jgi:hypothetical protein
MGGGGAELKLAYPKDMEKPRDQCDGRSSWKATKFSVRPRVFLHQLNEFGRGMEVFEWDYLFICVIQGIQGIQGYTVLCARLSKRVITYTTVPVHVFHALGKGP